MGKPQNALPNVIPQQHLIIFQKHQVSSNVRAYKNANQH